VAGRINVGDIATTIFKTKSENLFVRYLKKPFKSNSENKLTKKETAKNSIENTTETMKVDRKKTFMLLEENANVNFKLAECCHPIPGDDVLGYVDETEVVIIHKRQCVVASQLKVNFGERLVSAKWSMRKKLSFVEVLEVKGIDKKGVMIEMLEGNL
jgi:GTP diphosphokinase / guanosine-3',5'-bis(diphosphate) 3'-diphosphatase